MSNRKSTSYNWAPVIIVLLLVILIFAVVILPAWKKFGLSEEFESHETLGQRQARITAENTQLQSKVAALGITQVRLSRRFIWTYAVFVIGFLVTMALLQVGLYFFLKYFHLGNQWFWSGGIAGAFYILYTLITRKKFSFHELVTYCADKIKKRVYGDLINIEEDIKKLQEKIESNNQELEAITVPVVTTIIIPEQQQKENNQQ